MWELGIGIDGDSKKQFSGGQCDVGYIKVGVNYMMGDNTVS